METIKKPLRIIIYKNYQIFIDGISVNINNWLKKNENLWLNEWIKWSQAIALCNNYNVVWPFDSMRVSFRFKEKYIDFITWKKECYIKPAFELLPETNAFKFLKKYKNKNTNWVSTFRAI